MAARLPHVRVEPIDASSVRFVLDREVYRVYDVRITPPLPERLAEGARRTVRKVPLGAAEAEARVFVPRPKRDADGAIVRPGRLLYVLHREASRATDADTLAFQVGSAGWMEWMLHPPGALGPHG